jgi:hypothetical protein
MLRELRDLEPDAKWPLASSAHILSLLAGQPGSGSGGGSSGGGGGNGDGSIGCSGGDAGGGCGSASALTEGEARELADALATLQRIDPARTRFYAAQVDRAPTA